MMASRARARVAKNPRVTRNWSRRMRPTPMLLRLQRLGPLRSAVGTQGDLVNPRFGIFQHFVAMRLQPFAAFVNTDRFLKADLAAFELFDNALKLGQGCFESHASDIGVVCVGHQTSSSNCGAPPSPDPRSSACT